MATTTHSNRIVTWQSPRGMQIDVCRTCEERLRHAQRWPKDGSGEEYCQVHRGEHLGECDLDDTGRPIRLAEID